MIFGDTNTFAIKYGPDEENTSTKHAFAFCHLLLGGRLVGNPRENCMVGTWSHHFEAVILWIRKNQGKLRHSRFEGLTNQELFELICQGNTSEDDFRHELWRKHTIQIDETIDGNLIAVVEEDQHLKFFWMSSGWYQPAEVKGKLFTSSVDYNAFYQTTEECLSFLATTYPKFVKRIK